MNSTATRITALNDAFRKTAIGGQWYITRGIAALPALEQWAIMEKVRGFDTFTPDNDPYGEHDFGALEHQGQRIFWKIDYYAPGLEGHSEDPADPSKTVRVLTVMLAKSISHRLGRVALVATLLYKLLTKVMNYGIRLSQLKSPVHLEPLPHA